MPRTVVTVFQKNIKMGLNPLLQAKLGSEKSDFLVFPEYFFMDAQTGSLEEALDTSEKAMQWLTELSNSYQGVIIGGSIVRKVEDKLVASCPVFFQGQPVDFYDKRALAEHEKGKLTSGQEPGVFILNNHRFSVLLGEDVKVDEHLAQLAENDVRLVFVPYNASFKNDDTPEAKTRRDQEIFTEPAAKHNLTLVKVSAVGDLFERALQGRSLVATPNGITWRVGLEEETNEVSKNCTVFYPVARANAS